MSRRWVWWLIGAVVVGVAVVPVVAITTIASLMLPSTVTQCSAASLDENLVGVGGAGHVVVSYNIKHANVTAKSAGMGAHAEDFKWSNRGPVVVQYLRNLNADLIGLQEASRLRRSKVRQIDMIKQKLPGYRWLYSDTADPIGFRTSAFTLQDQGSVRLNWKGREGATLDRFARWAKLRAADGNSVIFVNLHAQFMNQARAAKARSVGWSRLIKGLKTVNSSNLPVIVVGDFNGFSDETRPVFRDHLVKLSAAGYVNSVTTATKIVPIPRVNSYSFWGDTIGGKFYYKAINRSATGRQIDYVWTRGDARATTWQIYTGPKVTWRTIKGEQVPFADFMPSDHWPVVAHVVVGSGTTTNTLSVTGGAAPATVGGVGQWSAAQVKIAAQIVSAGKSLSLDTWTITVGVMTGMGESSLKNLGYGDKAGPDSRGVFQQRSGWGPLSDRMDPYKASLLFFKALVKVPNYHSLAPTIAAHRTQINADPYHYEKHWDDAVKVVAAITADSSLLEGGQGCLDTSIVLTGDFASMIEFALTLVGKWPYAWGGGGIDGPSHGIPGGPGSDLVGFDCSGFTQYVVYKGLGINIGGDSRTQARWFFNKGMFHRTNDPDELQAGDILFFSNGSSLGSIYHVALVTQKGWIVEAPGGGRYIQHNPISKRMPYDIIGYGRFNSAAQA